MTYDASPMDGSWTTTASDLRFRAPVFSLLEKRREDAAGRSASFFVLDAPDWAHIILLRGQEVLLVRQWRHGSEAHSLEFPGGVVDAAEDAVQAARRELQEETGWTCGQILALGRTNPNPALMTNRVHTFLSTEPLESGSQSLDANESAEPVWCPLSDLLGGTPEFDESAIMLAGLAFLQRFLGSNPEMGPGGSQ